MARKKNARMFPRAQRAEARDHRRAALDAMSPAEIAEKADYGLILSLLDYKQADSPKTIALAWYDLLDDEGEATAVDGSRPLADALRRRFQLLSGVTLTVELVSDFLDASQEAAAHGLPLRDLPEWWR